MTTSVARRVECRGSPCMGTDRLEHLLLRTPPFVRYSSHVIETSSTQSVEGGRVLLGQIP